jgi:outer membrane autotransporter protein
MRIRKKDEQMAKGKARKEQTQKLLATVVMGMNLVNAAAPAAALAAAEPQAPQLSRTAASEAQPLDYAVLPQTLDYLDRAIFATAEATIYDGNDSGVSMTYGDSQTITAGQSGTVTSMNGGGQSISSGGKGTVINMSGYSSQNISAGGIGTVSTMDGTCDQNIYGGTGMVDTMNSGGYQRISGGSGTVITMSGGKQSISGGSGTVITMSGGTQIISGSGGSCTVDTMNGGGTQIISGSGNSGTVSTMNSGRQVINGSGGSGTVITMNSGGTQFIQLGSGTVTTMNGGGMQIINSGNGTVIAMNGGYQAISGGGSGTVITMNSGGTQTIERGGSGTVTTMNSGGTQIISGKGTYNSASVSGTVSTMNGGMQSIEFYGDSGTVITMNSGVQNISSGGNGTVITMNSGMQHIRSGGIGTVTTMNSGGQQTIDRGEGTVSTMSGGYQDIVGGSGTVITMSGGQQTIFSGIGTVSTMSGGIQKILDGGTGTVKALNGGTQVVSSGGTSLDTVLNSGGTVYQNSGGLISGITYNGGVQIIDNITASYDSMTLGSGGENVTMGVANGAQMSGTILNSGGMQQVLDGGTALATEVNGGTVYLASGGVVSDLTMSGGALELENIDGGSFNISGTMSANNGIIDMTDSGVTRAPATPTYETLTIADLKGSGNTFIMDTDLSGEVNSDKVTITSADVGTHYVQIRDLSLLNSVEVKGEHQQLLITDNSSKLTFVGKELNLGGLFDVTPTMTNGGALGLSTDDWYLTKIAKTANNDTKVLLFDADNSYALWRNTNDSLRSRLGALGNGSERADGIWARTQAGRFSGFGYEGRYNLYQLGYDQKADAKSTYGLAVDYGDGTGDYTDGSGKDKLTAFSLYGVWQGAKGTYTNVTARAGIFDTDLKSYGDFPDKASYKEHAYSISVEYGQRFDLQQGLFFEPQAQFTLGRLSGISYTTDRGANGHIEGMNSAIGRIGFIMGQKIKNGSDIYLKADLLHEFAGKRDLQLTSDAGGTNDILSKHNDYGDTWFELGLGANIKLSKDSSFYGEVERGFGGDINKKWSVNAGLRFTF